MVAALSLMSSADSEPLTNDVSTLIVAARVSGQSSAPAPMQSRLHSPRASSSARRLSGSDV